MSDSQERTSKFGLTPGQTVGPFFKYGLDYLEGNAVFGTAGAGRRITVQGRMIDGTGQGVPDGFLEVWQADGKGHTGAPMEGKCAGFGRYYTAADGKFRFDTVLPGSVEGANSAPFISVTVLARGLLNHVMTRIYFADQTGLDTDAVLVAAGERRATLIAKPAGNNTYEWNVVLQGENETVFLAY